MIQDLERYERIFKNGAAYGFVDWDLNNKHMTWEGGFWSNLGYSSRDMKKISHPESFAEFVHPDDHAELNGTVERHIKVRGPGEAVFRVRKKNGDYVWAEAKMESARDENGYAYYVSAILIDITRLKEVEEALLVSEARHARIIRASNDGVWEWSPELSFHFSSRCWEHLGYSENDDALAMGADRMAIWRERIHPDDLPGFDKAIHDHFVHKTPFDIEYRVRGKDEQWRWIRARGQMTYDSLGKPWRMSGTNMDITQLKQSEERVMRAKEDAEKANRAKSDFLSSMSHELRTPLNAILGFARLFDLDTNLSQEQKSNVEEIKKAGSHLLSLIEEVLDLSKIEAGKMEILPSVFDPHQLVKDCVQLMKTQIDARAIDVDIINDLQASQKMYADMRRTKQVMINLLSNSVKYNFDGGKIRITLKAMGDFACQISVADTGKGIPDEQQSLVFQSFNRLGAENSDIEGTGVGLSICKSLVEQMKGAMGFTSTFGQGSEFWFQLPLDDGFSEPASTQENASGNDAKQEDISKLKLNIFGTKKVLYVEDSLPNQRLMQQLLARYDRINLKVVRDGFSGIYSARTLQPDLIILDINLPGMSGYEALDILRRDKQTGNIPVIALSANATKKDIEMGKSAGFEYYLTKPLDLGTIISVFNEIFTRSDQ
jgi:PAS domain S-box-containing protein